MKTIVTGGTGFVGRQLCKRLIDQGHTVTALGTRAHADISHPHFHFIQADTSQAGTWQEAVAQSDCIFNLAGKTIAHRWTKTYKRKMTDSRILTTLHIVDAMAESSSQVLVNASAVGYYGNGQDELLTETAANGDDFLASLSRDWEAEALKASDKGVRVVLARFGIVLGKGGGALNSMLPSFRVFIGGPMGSGRQWFSWIHMEDLVNALLFVAFQSGLQGPVNLCAPHPVRNAELAHTIGELLGRPSGVAMPATVLKLALGEMASAALASQRVAPQKLLESGFDFQYPELEGALTQILG